MLAWRPPESFLPWQELDLYWRTANSDAERFAAIAAFYAGEFQTVMRRPLAGDPGAPTNGTAIAKAKGIADVLASYAPLRPLFPLFFPVVEIYCQPGRFYEIIGDVLRICQTPVALGELFVNAAVVEEFTIRMHARGMFQDRSGRQAQLARSYIQLFSESTKIPGNIVVAEDEFAHVSVLCCLSQRQVLAPLRAHPQYRIDEKIQVVKRAWAGYGIST